MTVSGNEPTSVGIVGIVGTIGLGGLNAESLHRVLSTSEYLVLVYGEDAIVLENLVSLGAKPAGSPRGVAENSHILVCTTADEGRLNRLLFDSASGVISGTISKIEHGTILCCRCVTANHKSNHQVNSTGQASCSCNKYAGPAIILRITPTKACGMWSARCFRHGHGHSRQLSPRRGFRWYGLRVWLRRGHQIDKTLHAHIVRQAVCDSRPAGPSFQSTARVSASTWPTHCHGS